MSYPYHRTPDQRPIFDKVRKSRALETGNAAFVKRIFLPALSCALILNYFAFRISSCALKIKLRLSSAIRIVLLFVNRTLTRLMRFAPFSFASFAVVTPSSCIVRRKEPRSPKRTELPSASVWRISYYSASNTALTEAEDTPDRFSMRPTIVRNITGTPGAIWG